MKNPNTICVLFVSLLCLSSYSNRQALAYNDDDDGLKQCLIRHSQNHTAIYTPDHSSFVSVLQYPIKNTRFNSSDTPKPFYVITPREEPEVQAVILCAAELNLQVRIRSGGHDYEGLSYTTAAEKRVADQNPFLVLDLINFNNVAVDTVKKTAWVGSGATVGELYYRISEKSKTLGFPAGVCHSIGVGGHFSGGGYGMMLRKHGLSADHVVDARLVDAKGRVLDRKSMGEDLFWAIRGGGGNTFGVVLSWKVKLVDVPETVTTFSIVRTPDQNATKIVHKWQSIATKLPQELFIRIIAIGQNSQNPVQAIFNSLYLGPADTLLKILQHSFPELGATRKDLEEKTWIESILTIDGFPNGTHPKALLGTIVNNGKPYYFKGKSDFVKNPIPLEGLEGVWDFLKENSSGLLIFSPYGGIMDKISESATPFPHRAGNLYKIQYVMSWSKAGKEAYESHMSWTRRLFQYYTPFVSKNPRQAYVNYRDLDIGTNNLVNSTYDRQSKNWGVKYYQNNFERLVRVKTKVDPHNFFRNEQSIPPLSYIVN
ncbi:PREDICTED: berberine bridge enzyme-like 15 [Ipomoea nil]|uniref:berberine bridge enzyme-like 15 n=1 Tax=Ipomoea nil TaxID=35883 RepID=UPI000901898D|nr:PREDICTED: berberine bridge enzyme-like 15 [Ipomoea nil]